MARYREGQPPPHAGVMPDGFARGMRVRISLLGRQVGIGYRLILRQRLGTVTGATMDGRACYVHWDGNVGANTAYLAAYLERVVVDEAPR